ncbi:ABC transporter substrate-binding protein [Pseudomonas sp. ABC1]|uniref:ABC transporter substrate-binding protein n=1 Tax=Pseudomonas sp. ABC1 TaxID=2748080 RepID=UPI00358FAE0A
MTRHLLPALLLVATTLSLFAHASVTAAQGSAPPIRERLVLAGPPAPVSYALLHMLESGALSDLARDVSFVQWSNPDQLRALVVQGQADFIAVPTNVAANLYNRGADIRLLNVSTWGALWIVSRNPGPLTLADFRGEEIAIPFRADMPDIVFGTLAERQGLDPLKDFRLRYTATPMDALQLLLMRRVDHALLTEPAVSMVLRKTGSFPVSLVAPELFRSVDMQAQWGQLLGGPARIPQAGLAVLGKNRDDARLVERLETAYAHSNAWCNEHPQSCGELVARHIKLLDAVAVADSLQTLPRHHASAAQAREELESFFRILLQRQPQTLGGKLPDAAFYGGAAAPQ